MGGKLQALQELPWKRWLTLVFHMPCLFHLLTGLYCPGCGGTRAVKYLLTGHPVLSLQYHPLVLYGVTIVVLELISAVIAARTGRRRWYLGHETLFINIAVIILIVNWIFKNYMLVVRGIDLLPAVL